MLISVENKNKLLLIHKHLTSLHMIFFDDFALTILTAILVTNRLKNEIDSVTEIITTTLHPHAHQHTQIHKHIHTCIHVSSHQNGNWSIQKNTRNRFNHLFWTLILTHI